MPNPKRRHSSHQTGSRRAHHNKLKAKNIGWCPDCGEHKLPHMICPSCGKYDGRRIVRVVKA